MYKSPNRYKRKNKQNKLYGEKNKSLIYILRFVILENYI